MNENKVRTQIPPKVMNLFAVIALLTALLLFLGSVVNIAKYKNLESRCTMQVTLQPKSIDEGVYHGWSSTGGSTSQKIFTLDYSFEAGGKTYEVSHKFKVPVSIRKVYTADDYFRNIAVLADPDEPTAIIWGDEDMPVYYIMLAAGIFFSAFAAVMFLTGRKIARRERSFFTRIFAQE